MNIQYGNGALVVVRAGEIPVHGEAEQITINTKILERCVRHLRNPIEVLKTLQEKANNENYQFERLYRNLYNEGFFFLLAYGNLCNKEGNLTKGTDGATIDGMGMERIRKLIVGRHFNSPCGGAVAAN